MMMRRLALAIWLLATSVANADTLLPGAEAVGSWQVTETVDPMDDSRTVIAAVFDGPLETASGGMILRCFEGSLNVFAHTTISAQPDTEVPAKIRVGKAAPYDDTWFIGSDNSSAGIWNEDAAATFMRSLRDQGSLVLRFTTPTRGLDQIVLNDLDGIDEVLDRLATACKMHL